jgi:structural maintenance of chromosome 1
METTRAMKERVLRRKHGLFFWITKRRNGLSNERTSLHLSTKRTFSSFSTTGASEYKFNGKVVTYTAYNAALILVKAKNLLSKATWTSLRELAHLIEQICGSLEIATKYEKAKEGQERATENATFNFTKRRGSVGEIKQYKEQKTEADKFVYQEGVPRQHLLDLKPLTTFSRATLSWCESSRSFTMWISASKITRNMVKKIKELVTLREDRRARDEEVEASRAQQAKACTTLMQKVKKIKKDEKVLEGKVSASPSLCYYPTP